MSTPRMARALVTAILLVGCQQVPEAPAPALTLSRDASPPPPDAAPPDAVPPDAAPEPLSCHWVGIQANEMAFTSYTFHGAIPWIGLDEPVSASCCTIPGSKVLCTVTDKVWSYIPVPNGALSIPSYIEHLRLFEASHKKPTHDLVISWLHPGPMNQPLGKRASHPLFRAQVELDTAGLHVVTNDDGLCTGRSLRCDAEVVEVGACGAYRRGFKPLVDRFCAGLGDIAW